MHPPPCAHTGPMDELKPGAGRGLNQHTIGSTVQGQACSALVGGTVTISALRNIHIFKALSCNRWVNANVPDQSKHSTGHTQPPTCANHGPLENDKGVPLP